MSIIVRETHRSQTGELSSDGARYEREYVVWSTEALTQDQACTASGIPARGAPYSSTAPHVILKSKAAEAEVVASGQCVYLVTCRYESSASSTSSYEDESTYSDPTQEVCTPRYFGVDYQVEMNMAYKSTDTRGNPTEPIIIPGTKEPLEEKAVRVITRPHVEIQFNTRSFNLKNWSYVNTVNKTDVMIAGVSIGAGQGRMVRCEYQAAIDENERTYYKVVYEIELAAEDHHWHPLRVGYKVLNGSTVDWRWQSTTKQSLDAGGSVITQSVLEKPTHPYPVSATGAASDEIERMDFPLYFEASWASLPKPIRYAA